MASAVQIPGYEILRPLGSGGMSTVYLAVQRSLDRKVAIKVMRRSSDPNSSDGRQLEKRFLLEGRMLAKLPHRNIVAVYDIVSNDSIAYIAMEHLGGGSLTDRMRSSLALAEAVSVIVQIAAALEFAHSHGVVHRDLKPANIMFRDGGTPVLTDFGIARYQDGSATKLTQTGMLVGTPTYMSPEQINADNLDGRSDLYSLGILFYELLTGAPPFKGDTPIAVLMAHLTQAPPPLAPELGSFQEIIDRMLAKNRDDRYANMKEFSQDLKSRLIQSDTLQIRLQVDPKLTTSEQLRALGFASTPGEGLRSPTATPAPTARKTPLPFKAKPVAPTTVTPLPSVPGKRPPFVWIGAAAAIVLLALGIWFFLGQRARLGKDEQELVTMWIKQADTYVAEDKLVTPPDQSAYAFAQKVLQKDPQNEQARALLDSIAKALKEHAESALKEGNLEQALEAASQGLLVRPDDASLTALKAQVEKAQKAVAVKQQVDALLARVKSAEEAQQIFGDNGAYTLLAQVHALVPDDQGIGQRQEALVQKQLAAARTAMQQGQLAAAKDSLAKLDSYLASDKTFIALKAEVEAAQKKQQLEKQFAELIDEGGRQLRDGHLNEPVGNNAYETFGELAKLGISDKRLTDFGVALARAFLDEARRFESKAQPERALDRAGLALQINPQLADAQALKTRIEQRLGERASQVAQSVSAVRKAIADQHFVPPAPNDAYTALAALLKLDPNNADAKQLETELPKRIADSVAMQAKTDVAAASAVLKSAQKVFPQDSGLTQLATKLDEQVAGERRAAQVQVARDTVAKAIAAQTRSVDELKTASRALAELVASDKNGREAQTLRKQFVEKVESQLKESAVVADFDALAKFIDDEAATLNAEPAYSALKKSVPGLRAKVVEAEQARVAAQLGELVLNAYPWGTVDSVLDASRKPVALPADASTPLILTLPAGSYVITFRHPRVEKASQVIAKVEAKKRVSANATFASISAQDYFSRAGW